MSRKIMCISFEVAPIVCSLADWAYLERNHRPSRVSTFSTSVHPAALGEWASNTSGWFVCSPRMRSAHKTPVVCCHLLDQADRLGCEPRLSRVRLACV